MVAENLGKPCGHAFQFTGLEVGLDLKQHASLFEGLAFERGRERNRLVDRTHGAVAIAPRRARLRKTREKMRHLERRNVQLARKLDRSLRMLDSGLAIAEALLEHRAKMVEVRPLHTARRR